MPRITVMKIEYGLKLNPKRVEKLKRTMHAFPDSLPILAFEREEALAAASIRVILRK